MAQQQRSMRSWSVIGTLLVITAVLLGIGERGWSEDKATITLPKPTVILQPKKLPVDSTKIKMPAVIKPTSPTSQMQRIPTTPSAAEDHTTSSGIPKDRRPTTPEAEETNSTQSPGPYPDRCFIATAAYGSLLAPQVKILRDFRDTHLLTNKPGRWFVEFYYQYSPPIASYIAKHENVRFLVRIVVTPLSYFIKYSYFALITVVLGLVTVLALRRLARSSV